MSSDLSLVPPILTIPAEMTDAILVTVLRPILPDYNDAASLWTISPSQWKKIARVKYGQYFQLRFICPDWDHRVKDIALSWSFVPLGQMDMDDLKVALVRSKEHPLTVLVTDADSIGLFWPLLQAASHRIRTLYIDVDAALWPAVSTSFQFYRFDQLRNVFLGARGVLEDKEQLISFMGMTGGWPASGMGGALAGHLKMLLKFTNSLIYPRGHSELNH